MYKKLLMICLLNLQMDSVMVGTVPERTVKGRASHSINIIKVSVSIFLEHISCSRLALHIYQPWANLI